MGTVVADTKANVEKKQVCLVSNVWLPRHAPSALLGPASWNQAGVNPTQLMRTSTGMGLPQPYCCSCCCSHIPPSTRSQMWTCIGSQACLLHRLFTYICAWATMVISRSVRVLKQGLRQARTYEELVAEAAEAEAEAAPSDSDEEDEFVYNPLKLPLGYDGKPIPFWLYKLHGLNQVCAPRLGASVFRLWADASTSAHQYATFCGACNAWQTYHALAHFAVHRF